MGKQAAYDRRKVHESAEIGKLPPVRDKERRAACEQDPALFMTTYMAGTFSLPFSPAHIRVIQELQQVIRHGGRQVKAVFRGFGKTSIDEAAALWAILYGYRKFIPIVGADQAAAENNIDSIKAELESNPRLMADFPEVCHAVWALEGKPQRSHSQTYKGKPTHVEWRADTLVLPMIEGSAASGSIIAARGLTGRIRGLKHKRRDGVTLRPDFVLGDDLQTDTSARSYSQVDFRLKLIRKAMLRLAGPSKKLSAVVAATVIEPDDVIDQLLGDKAWQGERIGMLVKDAKAKDKLWLGEYARIRRTFDKKAKGDKERAERAATTFYKERREKMDKGAEVTWQHCFDETELSAVQHAYNILIDDGEDVFASECQNQPVRVEDRDPERLAVDDVAKRINKRPRGQVPPDCQWVVGATDTHDKVIYRMAAAFGPGFTGAIIDYGAFPDQKVPYFTLGKARKSIRHVFKGAGREGAIQAGTEAVLGGMLAQEFKRSDGAIMKIDRLLPDAGYKASIIYGVCRKLGSTALMGSKGQGVGAANRPISEYRRKPGETIGHYWWIPSVKGTRELLHVQIDTNYWKSFVWDRLRTAPGDAGALTIFGDKPARHKMLAEHLARSEYPREVEGYGRKLQEWRQYTAKPDNHFFDLLVQCCVAASMLGCSLAGQQPVTPKRRRRVKLSDIQKRRT